jgi:hypothetical protein
VKLLVKAWVVQRLGVAGGCWPVFRSTGVVEFTKEGLIEDGAAWVEQKWSDSAGGRRSWRDASTPLSGVRKVSCHLTLEVSDFE